MDLEKRHAPAVKERSIPELVRQLGTDTTLLIGQELQLARAQLTQDGRGARGSTAPLGLSTIFALGAFGAPRPR